MSRGGGRVAAMARAVLARRPIADGPYFRALEDGSMGLEAFRRTQEQFYFAVEFYSRPMAALLARIPDAAARLDILHNLLEEHGDFRERAFHRNTFRRFLRSIGGRVPDLPREALWPELRAFNSVITAACVLDEPEVGVACMGIIEHAFSDVSSAIARAVVRRGWVKGRELAHYKLHARLDVRHAQEFYSVAEDWLKRPGRAYYVAQGLELGAYAFDRLYRDLREASLTRAGPATRARA